MNDTLRAILRVLAAWPLLIAGLAVLAFAVSLAEPDPSDVRALLSGIGAVLVGAGIVMVTRNQRRPPDDPPDA